MAPPDVNRLNPSPAALEFQPVVQSASKLPFPTVLVASRNDPYGAISSAKLLADRLGSEFVDVGEAGHVNADSGLGEWQFGQQLLRGIAQSALRRKGQITAV